MTLNLRFGLADDGPNGWAQRQQLFPDLLARLPMDFYCFQEANDFQVAFLRSVLPEHHVIGQRRPAPAFWQNNVIFYHRRWRCLRFEHFYLSATPEIPSRFRDSHWPRQCTMGLFACNDRHLVCVTTHLDFAPGIQSQSAGLILERLALWPAEGPIVIAGDFNASPSSPCHDLLTAASVRAFANVYPPPGPATHHGFTGKGNGDYIDWILYRGLARADRCGVFEEKIRGLFPSDHFPVWARWA